MSKIGQNLHSFEKFFSSPLDRQRESLKFRYLLEKLSPLINCRIFYGIGEKIFPFTNQLGQIFEKGQKFFNPLTNQLGIFSRKGEIIFIPSSGRHRKGPKLNTKQKKSSLIGRHWEVPFFKPKRKFYLSTFIKQQKIDFGPKFLKTVKKHLPLY